MTNRKLSLISQTMADLLIKQLAHELKNMNLYLSFANYFTVNGIDDLAEYYTKRAEEEDLHHQWIMNYLSNADCLFMYPAIEQNSEKIVSNISPFIQTVDREIQTTNLIYAIYEAAKSEKDFMTTTWLHEQLLFEQIEEENVSRAALTIMEEESDIYSKAKKVLKLLK